MARRHLVGGDAGLWTDDTVVPGLEAAQPGGLDIAVGLGRFAGFVSQSRDDGQVLAERRQWLEDRRYLVVGANLRWRPSVHDRAVRKPDKGEPPRGPALRSGSPPPPRLARSGAPSACRSTPACAPSHRSAAPR